MVEWLMEKEYSTTRAEGEGIGQMLMAMGYIEHVTKQRQFKDDYV